MLAKINTREESKASASGDMNSRFLTLLTTQLKNQDPLNPMENAEVTSQLAQMSTVDGIERLNKMFQSFVDGQSAYDSMRAAALVGRGVLVREEADPHRGRRGRRFRARCRGRQRGAVDQDAAGLEIKKIELARTSRRAARTSSGTVPPATVRVRSTAPTRSS